MQDARVTMYTTAICPFCIRARRMLDLKGVGYNEIAVDGQPQLKQEMIEKSGRFAVPQIWIGEDHIGGFTDIWALDASGELDKKLAAASAESTEEEAVG